VRNKANTASNAKLVIALEGISRYHLSAAQSTCKQVTIFIYLLVNKGFPHLFIYSRESILSYIVGTVKK
jgi:hypothetical protein